MDTKTSFLEQFKKAPLWQRIVLTTIAVLGIASYLFEDFYPTVEPAPGYLGTIQNEVSKNYDGSPVVIDLQSADHKLSIYILNPHGVDIGDVHNKDLEQFVHWIVNYLNDSGMWKSLISKNINKLEVGFKRTMPFFSMKRSLTLKFTPIEE